MCMYKHICNMISSMYTVYRIPYTSCYQSSCNVSFLRSTPYTEYTLSTLDCRARLLAQQIGCTPCSLTCSSLISPRP